MSSLSSAMSSSSSSSSADFSSDFEEASSSFFFAFSTSLRAFPLCCKRVGFGDVVCDNDVVENSATFDLPKIETDEAKIGVLVQGIVIDKFRVSNFLGLPNAFVRWVGNALCVPVTLVGIIIFHRCFPLPVLFIIPIVRFLSVSIYNSFLLHPVIRFRIRWVVDHGFVRPVTRLLVSWVRYFFRSK